MRKIKIMEHVSLDGVIQQENGEGFTYEGWTVPYRTPAGAEALAKRQGQTYDLLLGRRTYDIWAAYWPTMKGGPFAEKINAATKYVATHHPESLTWGPVQSLGTDILTGVRRVKETDGPDLILWGSSTLTSVLLEQGLVDEVVLLVYPVLLGQGRRLFSENASARELEFVDSTASPTGVLINTYRYVGPLRTGADAKAKS